MDRIVVRGGKPLQGSIAIGGAKNASLPLMAASLLTDETLTLSNLPHLVDITTMAHLLAELGVDIAMNGHAPNGGHTGRAFELPAGTLAPTVAPSALVRKMRASGLVLGPLMARAGAAVFAAAAAPSAPGRSTPPRRPGQDGRRHRHPRGYVEATAPNGLRGANIVFPKVTSAHRETP
jgi:UDP-N-acetylglucosamine 1-carboxyvinyltransferase